MSLTSALNTAKSSLSALQTQTSVASSNIANVNSPGATRKTATAVTAAGGGVSVKVTSSAQSSNTVLFRNMLNANSAVAGSSVQYEALSRINEILGDTNAGVSPQARLTAFQDALQDLASTPGSTDLGRAAVLAAQDLVTTLNENSQMADTLRRDADTQLVNAAADMNTLLAKLEDVNKKVIAGTAKGADVTDLVDQRDQIVTRLSEYVGLTVQTRGNNDVVLYTDSGVTLFETTARSVSFNATNPIEAGKDGNAFYIDGIAVTGDNSSMPLKSGLVAGAVQVRDEIAVTYQTQLDEIARELISSFAETQTSGGTTTTATGLFTSSFVTVSASNNTIAVPLENAVVPGLAGSLAVASTVLTDSTLIRDGVTYNYNPGQTGDTATAGTTANPDLGGYSDRINKLIDALSTKQTFSGAADAGRSATIADFAASSYSWLQDLRSTASDTVEAKTALLQSTQGTLSSETGINLDEELTRLLDLERSYQASSKIISVVDAMMQNLLESI